MDAINVVETQKESQLLDMETRTAREMVIIDGESTQQSEDARETTVFWCECCVGFAHLMWELCVREREQTTKYGDTHGEREGES